MHRRAPSVVLPPLVIALAVVLASGSVFGQAPPAPADLARSLQQRYQGVRDFSATFVHTYRGGLLRTQTREQGTMSVKKPGMMRFVYTAPEKKEFVSDGVKVYSYIPDDKQVIVASVPTSDRATSPAFFLSGKGDIGRDFTPSYVESPVAGTLGLKLVPRAEEPEYEYLVLSVEPGTLRWRALQTRDRQGGESTLLFSNLKENQGISDKVFVFRIPRGVDVMTDAAQPQ
jgi:outer membrane lipoprotein carrier protein